MELWQSRVSWLIQVFSLYQHQQAEQLEERGSDLDAELQQVFSLLFNLVKEQTVPKQCGSAPAALRTPRPMPQREEELA